MIMRFLMGVIALKYASVIIHANIISDRSLLWPKRLVEYEFDSDLGTDERQRFKELFAKFHAKTCIRFVPRKNSNDYLFFQTRTSKTLTPFQGRRGGRQELTFAPEDFSKRRVILRDLLRTLGFYYEMQRPDRFMFVDVHQEKIETKAWGLFRKINPRDINLLDEGYDYNSATHFGLEEYATGNQSTPFTVLAPNQAVGQDNGLSETDIRRINKAYKCAALTSENKLCPENWVAGQDGRCYYFSFLDTKSTSIEGPARRACERMLAIPMVMTELSVPSRGFVLDVMRHSQVPTVWVIGSIPSRDLMAERDSKCSIFDIAGNINSLDNGVPCDGQRRNFTCQQTAANECLYVRNDSFTVYPDCVRRF